MHLSSSKVRALIIDTMRSLETSPDLAEGDVQWLRQLCLRLLAELDLEQAPSADRLSAADNLAAEPDPAA